MEKNLKQEQSAIIKLPCLDRKYWKQQLAIQLADHYKTAWFLNLRGIICKRNGIKAAYL
jgi:hypothetical protein